VSLYVDIRKQLNNFCLEAAFETNGEATAIFGASGSGKSMILKCIAGIEKPDYGQIVFNDKVLFDARTKTNLPSRERNIGYLFQNYALFPNMSVSENIRISNRVSDTELKELLVKFEIENLENVYPERLSGGQQQRAAICRMLAAKPDVLMFDEPFSAIDQYLKAQLYKSLFNKIMDYHKYVFLVSHDFKEVYNLCEKILFINEGKILAYSEVKALYQEPQKEEIARLLGYHNIFPVRDGRVEGWNYRLNQVKPGKVCIPKEKIKIIYEKEPKLRFESYQILDSFERTEVAFKNGSSELIAIFSNEEWQNRKDPFNLGIDERDLIFVEE